MDVGAKQAGIVPASELTDDSSANIMEMFHKNDELDLIVLKVNDQEGIVTLSKKRCDAEAAMTLSARLMRTAPSSKALSPKWSRAAFWC